MKKILIILDDINKISKYQDIGLDTFIVPLEDYAIGYNNYFYLDNISSLSVDFFIIVNRLMDNETIKQFKVLIKKLPNNVKGIIFEDIGVFNIIKDLPIIKIWFQNHLGTNKNIVDYWLTEGCDYVILSSDITEEKIKNISNLYPQKVIANIFGYQNIMYSKRNLVSSYNQFYHLQSPTKLSINDQHNLVHFKVYEEAAGTTFFPRNIYNGLSLLQNDNIAYYIINSFDIEDKMLNLLQSIKKNKIMAVEKDFAYIDQGFLNQETIYQVKRGEQHE